MKKEIITSILAIGFTSALAIAAGTPVSYIFQGGDPASATQVNANFQELADRIEAGTYDYHNYVTDPSIQSKVFDIAGRCGDKETRTYTRVPVADGTEVTVERIETDAGTQCAKVEFDYLNSTTERQFLRVRSFDFVTGALLDTITFDNPITQLTSTMKMNTSWVDATTITYMPPSIGDNATIEKNTLAGIEDVTVPYNGGTTYTGCLKIHRTTKSNGDISFSTGYSENIIWLCPGVGITKNMAITSSGTLVTRELSDIQ